jgi:hypothetical protein
MHNKFQKRDTLLNKVIKIIIYLKVFKMSIIQYGFKKL